MNDGTERTPADSTGKDSDSRRSRDIAGDTLNSAVNWMLEAERVLHVQVAFRANPSTFRPRSQSGTAADRRAGAQAPSRTDRLARLAGGSKRMWL